MWGGGVYFLASNQTRIILIEQNFHFSQVVMSVYNNCEKAAITRYQYHCVDLLCLFIGLVNISTREYRSQNQQ